MIDSGISGFYRMTIDERLGELVERGIIDAATAKRLRNSGGLLSAGTADRMAENVIGVYGLPFAVAPNFLVNGRDYIVPMVIEEPSVVAAASAAAKLMRKCGGFTATSAGTVSTGQIHLHGMKDADAALARLKAAAGTLLALANDLQTGLVQRGGGAIDLEIRKLQLPDGRPALVLHLHVDTRDAMGANLVNTMCEGIAGRVEELSGARAVLKILTNLADRSLVTATVNIPVDILGAAGQEIRDAIVLANDIALVDPHRAATHNKGIMNGMDAVAVATGNDWRALEAGAHAYAARSGTYRALTRWTRTGNGDLHGWLTLPVRIGTVGGSLRSNPAALAGLCIAGVASSRELGELMTAAGLAQNFAALKALVTDGIQKGHMRLHARNVAATAAVPQRLFDKVVSTMAASGSIRESKARELVAALESADRPVDAEPRGRGAASGKVILLGEHAVVYGRPALAVPLPDALRASVYDSPAGTRLSIPAWDFREEMSSGETTGAMALLQLVMRRLGLESFSLFVDVDARIPVAAGLGSSAALAVAVIRALDQAFVLGMSDQAVNDLAFECETLAHGTPSGIDNTLAVFGQTLVYRSEGPERIRQLSLRGAVPLVVAWSGTRGMTREQVEGVRERWLRDKTSYDRIFDEIGRISLEGSDALSKGDFGRLGSLMNIGHGLLNALEVSTPLVEAMVDIARASGAAGAKLTGAGGGGSVVALCPGTEAQVSGALSAAGFEVICGFSAGGTDDEQG